LTQFLSTLFAVIIGYSVARVQSRLHTSKNNGDLLILVGHTTRVLMIAQRRIYDPILPICMPRGYGRVAILWKKNIDHMTKPIVRVRKDTVRRDKAKL
jgi:hypothetical protein